MNTAIKSTKLLFMGGILLFLLLIPGCKKESSNTEKLNTSIDTISIMSHIFPSTNSIDDFSFYSASNSDSMEIAKNLYSLDDSLVDEICFCISNSASAEEYVIVKSSEVEKVTIALKEHIENRIGDFTGYAPNEVEKLNNAKILTKGNYLILIVNNSPNVQEELFNQCMKSDFVLDPQGETLKENILQASTNTDSEPNNDNIIDDSTSEENTSSDSIEDSLMIEEHGVIEPVDTTNIVTAYKTNNPSVLTEQMDIEVFNECKKVIKEVITDDMTDYEKELAIHDYLVSWANYDENALIYTGKYTPYADTPYGLLINKNAICLGYSTTFKLFMDILDIECVIVKGSAYDTKENHAWNLVKLDNDWYAVDVTWDDPVGSFSDSNISHYFFNVTDKLLLDNFHHWDQDSYPAATGTKHSYSEDK